MKRYLAILMGLVVTAMPLAANSNLVSANYNMNYDYQNNQIGVRLTSFGLSWTYQGGETKGFHFRANPYLGFQMRKDSEMKTWLIGEDAWSIGSSFIIGYGIDLNLNSLGFILGGGLYTDINYLSYSENRSYQLTSITGIGANAKFYYQPWEGKFLFHLGIAAAWAPATLFKTSEFPDEWWSDLYPEQFYLSLNVGVGWRSGKKRPRSDS